MRIVSVWHDVNEKKPGPKEDGTFLLLALENGSVQYVLWFDGITAMDPWQYAYRDVKYWTSASELVKKMTGVCCEDFTKEAACE